MPGKVRSEELEMIKMQSSRLKNADKEIRSIPVRHSTAQGVPRFAQGVAALRAGGRGYKDIRLG